ncbi:hypothetical protein EVAR_28697_1 [Eumeta japonica]|uniref:Uncharacterized protein n=1 Tax=Eumeta variegata TaxID=151549 RepID=A0A4C1V5J2_EUMVA|nr:hypothetical protein EVAR_28697_1 [Eumeta japonica]
MRTKLEYCSQCDRRPSIVHFKTGTIATNSARKGESRTARPRVVKCKVARITLSRGRLTSAARAAGRSRRRAPAAAGGVTHRGAEGTHRRRASSGRGRALTSGAGSAVANESESGTRPRHSASLRGACLGGAGRARADFFPRRRNKTNAFLSGTGRAARGGISVPTTPRPAARPAAARRAVHDLIFENVEYGPCAVPFSFQI